MEATEIRRVSQRCDPVSLEPCGESEPDCVEAAGMVSFLTESRRVQKVSWRQSFVSDSMMSLLEGSESAQQSMIQPCPPPPEGGARSRWKASKADYRSGMEETEASLRSSQDRVQQVHDRRHKLIQSVQQSHNKRQQQELLAVSSLKAQNALRSCDQQLKQLRAESEAALSQSTSWQQLRERSQEDMAAVQEVMQIKSISFNQSESCVEIRPRLSSNELNPSRSSVNWRHDDGFSSQVDENMAGSVEGSRSGRWSESSAASSEVTQRYMDQAESSWEIQSSRSSFAIDWCPAQRSSVYSKSAASVCHSEVEEGYPGAGGARSRSVRRDGQPVDTSALKPHKDDPSSTDWSVFLCTCPLL